MNVFDDQSPIEVYQALPAVRAEQDDHRAVVVAGDSLAGDLGTVTDAEWLHAHRRLCDDLAGLVPAEQLAYVYEPTRSPAAYIGADENEPAPRVGEWDPFHDERFEGGGFRG